MCGKGTEMIERKSRKTTVESRVKEANSRAIFTPGPASFCAQNIEMLGPAFGRGDQTYDQLETSVLNALLEMTGHETIVRLQGSASLALEIATVNFVQGRVLLLSSGYYSDRLRLFALNGEMITLVDQITYDDLQKVTGQYDWVMACYVETGRGVKFSMQKLRSLADRIGAKLFIDATASIGLEDYHYLADIVSYSSCKGLCGLTGAAFIAFNGSPQNEVSSFYLNIETHIEKRVTGPYHIIQSIAPILKEYDGIRFAISTTKAEFMRRFGNLSPVPKIMQPQLCTHVTKRLKADGPAVMYEPRENIGGSVICHLGEAHLGRRANGLINELLNIEQLPKL